MALTIKTTIQIEASPESVWQVLTDFSAFNDWNPFLRDVTGDFVVGKKVSITAGGMAFRPTIQTWDKHKEIVWLGHLLLPGIFDGQHRFYLTENSDGTTSLEHSEVFRGILVPLFRKKLMTETRAGFEEMNVQLKKRVEGI